MELRKILVPTDEKHQDFLHLRKIWAVRPIFTCCSRTLPGMAVAFQY
jgi:hypothetical protein